MVILRSKLVLLACLLAATATAQSELVFNKRFVECEDKWVVFRQGKDGAYMFGFIYIDQMAGLTLNYEGNFTITENGRFEKKPVLDSARMMYKVRLQNNNVQVALLPESKFAELDIAAEPGWLHVYKEYADTAQRLQRWGYYYNDFGMSEKALQYLEPGYKKYPDYKGMAVELSFAYNALGKYEQAIPVLNKAIELTLEDWYLYKELSFALLNTGKMEDAGEAAVKGINHAGEDAMKAEIAYNLAYQYYKRKDKDRFARWARETLQWAKNGDQFYNAIKKMEPEMQ